MVERVGKSFQIWDESLTGKGRTGNQRREMLEDFLKWKGLGYDEYYQRYYEAWRSPDPRDLALMNTGLVSWYKEAKGWGVAPATARNYVTVVVSFLAENGLNVVFTRTQRKEMSRRQVVFKDNWAKEEIRQLLASTTSARNQALAHSFKDCGMAVSDVSDLNVGDLRSALENGDKFAQIEYTRNKTGEYGTPCFGYESLDAIRAWMRWRRENGYNCAADSPLFVLVKESGRDADAEQDLLGGVRMSGHAMSAIIDNMVDRAGLGGKRLSAHSFRIYNSSCLESAGVNKNIVYRIQARQIPDSGKAYSKGEVLSSYVKAYDSLVVGPKPQIIEVADPEMDRKIDEVNRKYDELMRRLDAKGLHI